MKYVNITDNSQKLLIIFPNIKSSNTILAKVFSEKIKIYNTMPFFELMVNFLILSNLEFRLELWLLVYFPQDTASLHLIFIKKKILLTI